MTDRLLASAAPVFEVDGEVHGELARDIVRLEVEETTSGLKTLCARLVAIGPVSGADEERLMYLNGEMLDFGTSLDVSIGMPPDPHTIFRGHVSAIEASFEETHEPEVIVFAEDRFMDLRMTRRARTYESMSDAEIAEEIASEHGLSVEANAPGPTYDVVQQWNISDLAFLRERARLVQADVWLDQDTLYFQGRQQRGGTELTLIRGNQLISAQLRADLAHQRTAVHVSGYDVAERAVIDEEAGADAIQSEIAGGRTGPAVLSSAFGERVSRRVREVPLTSNEAADWARNEMLRRARGFVQVTGVTDGTANMSVGSRITLERVGQPFNGGGYYVTRVRHTYDMHGYRTHFEAERATVEESS